MTVELVEIPCGLGLLPRGVENAPAALRSAGLPQRLGVRRVHTVPCPRAEDTRDEETALLRPSELIGMATRLADTIGRLLDPLGIDAGPAPSRPLRPALRGRPRRLLAPQPGRPRRGGVGRPRTRHR